MKFDEVRKLKSIGVYIIYHGQEIIYVGSTKDFRSRFGTGMMHKSTHILHKKLLEEGKTKQEIIKFFKNKCEYKIKICDDKLKAEMLGHFVIEFSQPKYNKGIYKKPNKQNLINSIFL